MDIINEQKLADALAPIVTAGITQLGVVIKTAIDEAALKAPEAVKEALDGLTITITISKKTV